MAVRYTATLDEAGLWALLDGREMVADELDDDELGEQIVELSDEGELGLDEIIRVIDDSGAHGVRAKRLLTESQAYDLGIAIAAKSVAGAGSYLDD